jgi:N-acetylmuramoyl-L-alanine amidase
MCDFHILTNRKTPNYDKRPVGVSVDTVVIHATAGPLVPSLNWLCSKQSQVSCHYVIGKGGEIYRILGEEYRAWHAGRTEMPDGREWANDYSIGIEVVNANDGKDPYPDIQVEALVWLLKNILARRGIRRANVVTHAEIARPKGRKTDPKGLDVGAVLERVYEG